MREGALTEYVLLHLLVLDVHPVAQFEVVANALTEVWWQTVVLHKAVNLLQPRLVESILHVLFVEKGRHGTDNGSENSVADHEGCQRENAFVIRVC